jgi:hypothetical protein
MPGYLTSKQFNVENLAQIPLPESPEKMPFSSPVLPASLFKHVPGFDPFEKLSKDVIVIIASNMRLKDLMNFCLTSSRFNRLICDNEVFWFNKTQLDFKNAKPKPENISWKRYYQELAGLVENELAFANLEDEVMAEIMNLPPEEQLEAVNQMRREAGLGPVRRRLDLEEEMDEELDEEIEAFHLFNDLLNAYREHNQENIAHFLEILHQDIERIAEERAWPLNVVLENYLEVFERNIPEGDRHFLDDIREAYYGELDFAE